MIIIAIELMKVCETYMSCTLRFWLIKELSTTVGVEGGANTVTKERGTVTPVGSCHCLFHKMILYMHMDIMCKIILIYTDIYTRAINMSTFILLTLLTWAFPHGIGKKHNLT